MRQTGSQRKRLVSRAGDARCIDFDGDGILNGMEYAPRLDPKTIAALPADNDNGNGTETITVMSANPVTDADRSFIRLHLALP